MQICFFFYTIQNLKLHRISHSAFISHACKVSSGLKRDGRRRVRPIKQVTNTIRTSPNKRGQFASFTLSGQTSGLKRSTGTANFRAEIATICITEKTAGHPERTFRLIAAYAFHLENVYLNNHPDDYRSITQKMNFYKKKIYKHIYHLQFLVFIFHCVLEQLEIKD